MKLYLARVTDNDGGEAEVKVFATAKERKELIADYHRPNTCLLYTSPSPRDGLLSRMPSSA